MHRKQDDHTVEPDLHARHGASSVQLYQHPVYYMFSDASHL